MRGMRTLGPGSVSSLLKTVLDVIYILMWIVGAVTALAMLVMLVVAPFAPTLNRENAEIVLNGQDYGDLTRLLLLGAGGLFGLLLYFAGLISIIGRLRRIFATLIVGDPFQPENVRRLRIIGAVLAALLILGHLGEPLAMLFAPDLTDASDLAQSFSPTSWFAVLVVFVLAEVFREGARLRHEAELTI